MLLQILHDLAQLAGKEAVGVGERHQQCMHVQALGRRLGIVAPIGVAAGCAGART
jgi:hypothetical protein